VSKLTLKSRLYKKLVHMANADPADLRDDKGEYIPIHKLPPHIADAIASIKHDKSGKVIEIKLYPAEKARAMLRRLKCFGAA
jgi:hypothetical protein